ncbi:single-stranded DNA-binding protein [Gordonia hirsuta DSM 44140 = NBRC 16056]|uniref:Single-stranded DNA-binding protein n=1 Tax=Gordonia hirsuta DSM 44140 = NBRC 16056 TaxID=1121927 RepID=L7LBY7_9ACTN|nr:single-stranded DNA-binding protein [Gordonia hirsuta]GAC57577.1 single-stranded DNA-binding protein [Gordonia hirsuta DSM 44140 = NBRC 16056]
MYETYTTITGRVMNDPRRRTAGGGQVLSFRVACNSRKRDRETGEWNDGHTLYLTVACWDKLAAAAEGVIQRGSRVIARGQLWTNEYVAADGTNRSDLEMKALAIGLDLAHARAVTTPGREGHSEAEPPQQQGWSRMPEPGLQEESAPQPEGDRQPGTVPQAGIAPEGVRVPAAEQEAVPSFP